MKPTEHGLRADFADSFDLAGHRRVAVERLVRTRGVVVPDVLTQRAEEMAAVSPSGRGIGMAEYQTVSPDTYSYLEQELIFSKRAKVDAEASDGCDAILQCYRAANQKHESKKCLLVGR